MKDSLGDRMKANYEDRYRFSLTRRTPVIIRVDGKAFHTLTRNCEKPFDMTLSNCMIHATQMLCKGIQGAKCAYTQSDEISILITDYDSLVSEAWFDYNLQKIVSVSASIATAEFNNFSTAFGLFNSIAMFDARAFNVPKEEVTNYFIWRQMDWIRNSVEMLARSQFSHKDLHKKNQSDIHEMLHTKGVNWAMLEPRWKNGSYITKVYETDNDGVCQGGEWKASYPDFRKDRSVIENLLESEVDNND